MTVEQVKLNKEDAMDRSRWSLQTPRYVPKKTQWVFWVHPPKKTHPPKNPHFYFNLILVYTLYSTTTHTHNRFTAGLEYVRVHPGQQVPER